MRREPASTRNANSRASTLPPKMSRYILDTSALHRLGLTLTVIVFLIEVVPLELQHRIVNDAPKHYFQLIVNLCVV